MTSSDWRISVTAEQRKRNISSVMQRISTGNGKPIPPKHKKQILEYFRKVEDRAFSTAPDSVAYENSIREKWHHFNDLLLDISAFNTDAGNWGTLTKKEYFLCQSCSRSLVNGYSRFSPDDYSVQCSSSSFFSIKPLESAKNLPYEPFEVCNTCERKWHKYCALYDSKINPEDFHCHICRAERSVRIPKNKFTAKVLPHCTLSRHIEGRVKKLLYKNCGLVWPEVLIRVLSATEEDVEVKPLMKQRYCPEGFPEKFPYRSKAIFAFQVIDGAEVCFFALYVQEYGSNCPPPNQRRVYMGYMDSVHYFQPRHIRTAVYHEIMLGYLEHVRNLGYRMAHMWACPPDAEKGEDYIFNRHPPEQKIPMHEQLQEWYKKMLNKGILEKTVKEYKDIWRQAEDEVLTPPKSLPYFEGDFWPDAIEKCIESSVNTTQTADNSGITNRITKRRRKRRIEGRRRARSRRSPATGAGDEVADKLYASFEQHKEVFFTIKLHVKGPPKEIKDPDPLVISPLAASRTTFLGRSHAEHWEFSSLCRAKYSTMCFLYYQHTEKKPGDYDITECDQCRAIADLHCHTCTLDLCLGCFKQRGHPHEMEKLSASVVETNPRPRAGSLPPMASTRLASLLHAKDCELTDCSVPRCNALRLKLKEQMEKDLAKQQKEKDPTRRRRRPPPKSGSVEKERVRSHCMQLRSHMAK